MSLSIIDSDKYDWSYVEGQDHLLDTDLTISDQLNMPSAVTYTAKPVVNPPSSGSSYYYTVTLNFLDKDTGQQIATSYRSSSYLEGHDWDLTDRQLDYIMFGDTLYAFDSVSDGGLTGTNIHSNITISLYYTIADVVIEEPDVPLAPEPQTDVPIEIIEIISDTEVPLDQLPQIQSPVSQLDTPKTGVSSSVYMLLAVAVTCVSGFYVLSINKKRV